ncbi:unnamed protein product [Chrysoparadoxa australica]
MRVRGGAFTLLLVAALCQCSAFSFPVSVHGHVKKGVGRGFAKHNDVLLRQNRVLMSLQGGASSSDGVKPGGAGSQLVTDSLSGMTCALASIPSSIAFAAIAGVNPLIGIWSSVVLGLTTAIWGGRPGLITGAAGVVVVPLAPLVATHGTAYMGAAILVAGVMELLFGCLKLGSVIKLVTPNVMCGFLNGLGLLLLKSQASAFQQAATGAWLARPELTAAAGLAAATAAIVQFLPKLTTAVPSALVGVAATSVAAVLMKLPVKTLTDVAGAATFQGGWSVLPTWSGLPAVPLALSTLKVVAPVALSIAVISLMETLLAVTTVNDSKGSGKEGDLNRTCVGLGLGNLASMLMGGFGGCGLMPQTLLNLQQGGRGTASSLSYALSMAVSVAALAGLIGQIPLASLGGLMIAVSLSTIQWKDTFARASAAFGSKREGVVDFLAMAVASAVCVTVDMGAGIVAGVSITQANKWWRQRKA